MPFLRSLISPAVNHLLSLGIEPTVYADPPVHVDQLDAFNAEFGLKLPIHLRRIYSETDGFMISWESGDDWGQFQIPTLYELRLCRQRWVNGDMPDEDWTTHLPDHEARAVLEHMASWLPFNESGSGDLMCVDCNSGRIVEYDHEWGNLSGRNGTMYANDLGEYIENCGRLCFHSVWCERFPQVVRGELCWTDWQSARVPARYVVRDSNAT